MMTFLSYCGHDGTAIRDRAPTIITYQWPGTNDFVSPVIVTTTRLGGSFRRKRKLTDLVLRSVIEMCLSAESLALTVKSHA